MVAGQVCGLAASIGIRIDWKDTSSMTAETLGRDPNLTWFLRRFADCFDDDMNGGAPEPQLLGVPWAL